MIVLYGKFYVRKELTINNFLEKSLAWVRGMKQIPEAFKTMKFEQTEMKEVRDGINLVEYAIDNEQKLAAFCLKLEDDNGELWRTDLVLQEGNLQGIMQIRLAREQKRATAEKNADFRLPWVLRQILNERYGGEDNGLLVDNRPFYLDTENLELAEQFILSPNCFIMPIVYVSKPFYSDSYYLDVKQLAVDLAGIAHVVVESDSSISSKLREMTEEKNPYNGAVGIYYGKDDYVRMKKNSWDNNNQFRWKVSHSIYSRMAMLNIPEKQSISWIRSNILIKQVQNNNQINEKDRRIQELEIQLEQKINDAEESRQELQEYIETFGDNEKIVYDLEAKVQYYQDVIKRQKDLNETGFFLKYTEDEFYPDEIKDVVLEILDKAGQGVGASEQKRRSYHILQDIKKCNKISKYRREIMQSIREVIERGNVNEKTISDMQRIGFEIKGNGHQKAYYHGDGRYMVTLASTPSEHRGGINTAHDTIDIMFK